MVRFDPSSHLPLTPAMFQVLVALADGEKHGYAIIKEVSRRTDGKVRLRAGTLYTAIRRFVDSGLIQESAERP
ncbi:MAG TPA: helix-turn-helix transcriptional regulator, partial [Vicinamibacterales bacterium]|nr:helix-turn-helix transcriptional regulator [Vicinamibacterales bacterium]